MSTDQTPAKRSRRTFLEIITAIAALVVGVAPLVLGVIPYFGAALRKRSKPLAFRDDDDGGDGFIRVTVLEALPVGGPPQRFPVIDDRQDAWNFEPDQPIGAVYLERTGPQEVRAFNATCPHAGCSVAFERGAYRCPCHNSAFAEDGSKLKVGGKENPSPRGLDPLAVDESRLAGQGEVWVKYQDFYSGRHQRVAKT